MVREYHFFPNVIGELYIDNQDFEGLEYWYDDVVEVNKQLETK